MKIFADQYAYNTSGTDGRIVLIPGWLGGRLTEAGLQIEGMSPAELVEKGIGIPSINMQDGPQGFRTTPCLHGCGAVLPQW